MNLAGLSAAYPGYQAAEQQTAETQKNQYAAREAAIKLLGAHALGAALASAAQNPQAQAGGAPPGPQAPPPGQASVPMRPPGAPPAPSPSVPPPAPPPAAPAPPPPAAPAPAPASPAPAVAPPGPQAAAGGLSEVTLSALTRRLVQANPGIVNHPEIFMAAVERAAPLLDRQGKEDIADMRKQFTEQRLEIARQRLEEAKRHHDLVSEDKAARESNVNTRTEKRLDTREDQFSRLHPNAPAVGAPSPDTPPAPPLAILKPNTVTTFANGQKWTIGPDGQPKQVQ